MSKMLQQRYPRVLLNLLIFIVLRLDAGSALLEETIVKQRGGTVVLSCPIDFETCGKLHSLNWLKGDTRIGMIVGNGTSISKEYKGRAFIQQGADGPTTSLTLKDLEVFDEGTYICDTTFFVPQENCESSSGYRIHLQVTENENICENCESSSNSVPPKEIVILDQAKNLIKNGSIVGPLEEYRPFEATCYVKKTRPAPSITWYIGGHIWKIPHPAPIIQEEDDDLITAYSTIDISELSKKELMKPFECRVESAAFEGTIISQFVLDIYLRPTGINLTGVEHHTVQGNQVTLVCKVLGARPEAQVAWKNSSELITPSSADDDDDDDGDDDDDDDDREIEIETTTHLQDDGTITTLSKLHFTATRFENDHTFRCEGENSILREHREKPLHVEQTLDVLYPPVVKIHPASSSVNVSHQVLLSCDYIANPASLTNVKWYRNNELVNVSDSRFEGGNPENVALSILSTKREDYGNYTCELTNSIGTTISTPIELDVHYVPIVEVLMYPDKAVREDEETNVTLYCNIVDSNPANLLKVRWYANASLLKELPDCNETREDLCHVDPSKLLLESIGRGFFFNYSCEGFNTAGWGPRSEEKELVVHYEPGTPTISYYPLVAIKKKSVTFSCSVDDPGYPTNLTYKWFKGGHEVGIFTKDWTVDPVDLDIRTNISCIVSNEGGDSVPGAIALNVHAPPAFIQNMIPYTGFLHTTKKANLSCRVECVPRCSITWFKDEKKIDLRQGYYYVKEEYLPADPQVGDFESVYSELHFNMSAWPSQEFDIYKDKGIYTCQSSGNTAGPGVKSSTSFWIEYPPMNTTVTPNHVDVWENHNPKEVQCESNGVPAPKILWYYNDKLHTDSSKLFLKPEPMTRGKGGKYVCIATNKHGTHSAIVEVNVQYKPNCTITRKEIDEEDTLICTADSNPVEKDFQWLFKSENDSVELERGRVEGNSSYLILGDDFTIQRTYRCVVNNSVGSSSCQIEVAGRLAWYQKWDKTTVIILIASVLAVLIAVMIICIIIICICRRRRRQEKYQTESSISATHSVLSYQPPSPLPSSISPKATTAFMNTASLLPTITSTLTSPRTGTSSLTEPPPFASKFSPASYAQNNPEIPKSPPKWPLRPGVMVHVKGDTKQNLCANRMNTSGGSTTAVSSSCNSANMQITIPSFSTSLNEYNDNNNCGDSIHKHSNNNNNNNNNNSNNRSGNQNDNAATNEGGDSDRIYKSNHQISTILKERKSKSPSSAPPPSPPAPSSPLPVNYKKPIGQMTSNSIVATEKSSSDGEGARIRNKSQLKANLIMNSSDPATSLNSSSTSGSSTSNSSNTTILRSPTKHITSTPIVAKINPNNVNSITGKEKKEFVHSLLQRNSEGAPSPPKSISAPPVLPKRNTNNSNKNSNNNNNDNNNGNNANKNINSNNNDNTEEHDLSVTTNLNEPLPPLSSGEKKNKEQSKFSANNDSNLNTNSESIRHNEDITIERIIENKKREQQRSDNSRRQEGKSERKSTEEIIDNNIDAGEEAELSRRKGIFTRVFRDFIFSNSSKIMKNKKDYGENENSDDAVTTAFSSGRRKQRTTTMGDRSRRNGFISKRKFMRLFQRSGDLFRRYGLRESKSSASNPFATEHHFKGIRCSGSVVTYKRTPALINNNNGNNNVSNVTVTTSAEVVVKKDQTPASQQQIHGKSSTLRDPLTEPGEYENLPFHGLQTAPNKFITTPINFNNSNIVRVAPRQKLIHNNQRQKQQQQHQHLLQQQQYFQNNSNQSSKQSAACSMFASQNFSSNNNSKNKSGLLCGASTSSSNINSIINDDIDSSNHSHLRQDYSNNTLPLSGNGDSSTNNHLHINYNLNNCFPRSYTEYYQHHQQKLQQKQHQQPSSSLSASSSKAITIPINDETPNTASNVNSNSNNNNNLHETITNSIHPYTVENSCSNDNNLHGKFNGGGCGGNTSAVPLNNNPFLASNFRKFNTSISRPGSYRKKFQESDRKFYSLKSLGHRKGLHFCSIRPSISITGSNNNLNSNSKCKRHHSFAGGSSVSDVVSGAVSHSMLAYPISETGIPPTHHQTYKMNFYEPPLYENLTDSIQIHEIQEGPNMNEILPPKNSRKHPFCSNSSNSQIQKQHSYQILDDYNNLVNESERLSIYRSDSGISNSSYECVTPIPAPRQLLGQTKSQPHNLVGKNVPSSLQLAAYMNFNSAGNKSSITTATSSSTSLSSSKQQNPSSTYNGSTLHSQTIKSSPSMKLSDSSYPIDPGNPSISSYSMSYGNPKQCKCNNNNGESCSEYCNDSSVSNSKSHTNNNSKECPSSHFGYRKSLTTNRKCKRRTLSSASLMSLEHSSHTTNPFITATTNNYCSSSSGFASINTQGSGVSPSSSSSSTTRNHQTQQQQQQQRNQQQKQQQQILVPNELNSSSSATFIDDNDGEGYRNTLCGNKSLRHFTNSNLMGNTSGTSGKAFDEHNKITTNYNSDDNSLTLSNITNPGKLNKHNKPSGYVIRPMKLPLRKHHSFHFQPSQTVIGSTKSSNRARINYKQNGGPLVFKPFLNERSVFIPISPPEKYDENHPVIYSSSSSNNNTGIDAIMGEGNDSSSTNSANVCTPPRICGTSLKSHMSDDVECRDSSKYEQISGRSSRRANTRRLQNSNISDNNDYKDGDAEDDDDDDNYVDDDDNNENDDDNYNNRDDDIDNNQEYMNEIQSSNDDEEIDEIIITQNLEGNDDNVVEEEEEEEGIEPELSMPTSSSPCSDTDALRKRRLIYADLVVPLSSSSQTINNARITRNNRSSILNSTDKENEIKGKLHSIARDDFRKSPTNGDYDNEIAINSDSEQLRRNNRLKPVLYHHHYFQSQQQQQNYRDEHQNEHNSSKNVSASRGIQDGSLDDDKLVSDSNNECNSKSIASQETNVVTLTPTKRTTQYATLKFNEVSI